MKVPSSISCVILAVNFLFIFNETFSLEDQELNEVVGDELQVDKDRWERELKVFRKGLKMRNEKGELVELTTEEDPLKISAFYKNGINIIFNLYTKNNSDQPQRITRDYSMSMKNSLWNNFDPRKPTYFITHGWASSGNDSSCTLIRNALLKKNEFNVIVVDWSEISALSYLSAARYVPSVAKEVARMIEFLSVNVSLNFTLTHLVGHSLGAHVMGIAGYLTNGKIHTIYGLDPALPLFTFAGPGSRLSSSDATHVQIIHTNAGILGHIRSLGTSDFYPNGGLFQFGCGLTDLACSHSRAYQLFAESINSWKGFWGKPCNRFYFIFNLCDLPEEARMGGISVDPKIRGNYYLWTNKEFPYATGKEDLSMCKKEEKKD